MKALLEFANQPSQFISAFLPSFPLWLLNSLAEKRKQKMNLADGLPKYDNSI